MTGPRCGNTGEADGEGDGDPLYALEVLMLDTLPGFPDRRDAS